MTAAGEENDRVCPERAVAVVDRIKPRILFVSHTARWAGPTNSLLLLLSEVRQQFDSLVLVPGTGPFSEALRREGIPFISLPALTKRSIPDLYRIIRTNRIQLVYGNNLSGGCRNALIAARLARVPFIWHVREMGREEKRGRLFFLRLADAAVAVSEACADSLRHTGSKPFYVVHNGIAGTAVQEARAVSRQYVDASAGTKPDVPIVIGVAHLGPRKGQAYAIRALAGLLDRAIEAQLLLVGSPDFHPWYADSLKRLARELGIEESVVFAGFRDDVPLLLNGSHVLLHTARSDPHPRSVLEAMAAALPVVAFATDGVRETVVSGTTGELVPFGNTPGLISGLQRALSDGALAAAWGRAGKDRVHRHFSATQTALRIASIIDATLCRAAPAGLDV